MSGKKLPKNERGEKNRRLSVLAEVQPFTIQNTSELTQLLIGLNRLHHILVIKLSVTEDNHFAFSALDMMFPWIHLAKSNTLLSLQAENINLFFWRAICQRGVTSKRASDAATLSAKLSTNNDMLSKAERDTRDMITHLDISRKDLDKEEELSDLMWFLKITELNILLERTYKAIRLTDSSFVEETLFPKLEVFELTMTQGIFSNEVIENEFVNQSSLSKLLGSKG
jgi:hypothetical protein